MEQPETAMGDFSKHLLVTIFAIFAFTSGPLLGTDSTYVKVFYILSLTFAILSMNYGFKSMLNNVNEIINNSSNNQNNIIKDRSLPLPVLNKMKINVRNQYFSSTFALILLTVSIVLHFFNK